MPITFKLYRRGSHTLAREAPIFKNRSLYTVVEDLAVCVVFTALHVKYNK